MLRTGEKTLSTDSIAIVGTSELFSANTFSIKNAYPLLLQTNSKSVPPTSKT